METLRGYEKYHEITRDITRWREIYEILEDLFIFHYISRAFRILRKILRDTARFHEIAEEAHFLSSERLVPHKK